MFLKDSVTDFTLDLLSPLHKFHYHSGHGWGAYCEQKNRQANTHAHMRKLQYRIPICISTRMCVIDFHEKQKKLSS